MIDKPTPSAAPTHPDESRFALVPSASVPQVDVDKVLHTILRQAGLRSVPGANRSNQFNASRGWRSRSDRAEAGDSDQITVRLEIQIRPLRGGRFRSCRHEAAEPDQVPRCRKAGSGRHEATEPDGERGGGAGSGGAPSQGERGGSTGSGVAPVQGRRTLELP
jgi:hypothetical protein